MYLAELACYYARVGDFERAESSRVELRRVFGDGRDLRVSVLIMTLEALLLYFRELNPAARDRLLRAKLLCTAGKEERLLALTSAWLAHIDFNLERFDDMSESIALGLKSLDADDGTAECRLALVLGDAFMYCDQENVARHWYERAHLSATRLGDQAAIGAMTYNRAALRVTNLRLAQVVEPSQAIDFALARAELKSATNYQAVAGLRSLDHLLRAAQVGVLMLENDFSKASAQIQQILDSGEVPSHSGAFYTLRADRLTCSVKLGDVRAARECAEALTDSALKSLGPDDRVHCLAALEGAEALRAEIGDLQDYGAKKRMAIEECREHKRRLLASIARYAPQEKMA
jgi:predicted negative regulator of RcsB-dependent stress response